MCNMCAATITQSCMQSILQCSCLRTQSMKYETLETRKDGTKFLSRDMKRAATRLQQVAAAYDSKQQKLVEEVRQPMPMPRRQWLCLMKLCGQGRSCQYGPCVRTP